MNEKKSVMDDFEESKELSEVLGFRKEDSKLHERGTVSPTYVIDWNKTKPAVFVEVLDNFKVLLENEITTFIVNEIDEAMPEDSSVIARDMIIRAWKRLKPEAGKK